MDRTDSPYFEQNPIPLDSIRPRSSEEYSVSSIQQHDPFATPPDSARVLRAGASTALRINGERWFHSRRVKKGSIKQPIVGKKDPREIWVTIIPLLGVFVGLAISAVLIWDGLRTVVNHTYCPILDETWSNGFNDSVWVKEAEVGGFGNGEFEQTTNNEENAFVQDGMLHIKPTLQDPKLIEIDGSTIDLFKEGICASQKWSDCMAVTNHTNSTIIPPVKSARVSTKVGAKIKYGRIEVTAKLPTGDWLWPGIWMLPVDNKYGEWPRSGEIDIVESRGNDYRYKQGGNNIASSTLHWGPNPANDAWWRNNVKRKALHTTFSKQFHTFGLEWSEKYIFTYIDNRLLQIMYTNFDEPFWQKGQFPLSDSNGTRLDNPWSLTGHSSSPFDQDFYLILSLGVGGTNGWFQDGEAGKPWVDSSPSAKLDFWNARDKWLPTWELDGQMIIKRVQMWQQKGYNGC